MKNALVVLTFALGAMPVWASSLTIVSGTSGAGWQSLGTINQDGAPYWDKVSWDTGPCNISNVMTGTQACGPNIPGGPLNAANLLWWGLVSGAADPSFLFSSSSLVQFTDLFSVTARAGTEDFGWYDPSSSATGSVFGPGSSPGDTTVVSLPATFGVYLNSGTALYKSGGGSGQQQFAVFQDTNTGALFIGAEDLSFDEPSGSDYDFNDRAIKIQAELSAPEPSTLILMSAALVGMLIRRRAFSSH
jgi:hypothetical protein